MAFELPPVKADEEMLLDVLTFSEKNDYTIQNNEHDVVLNNKKSNLKIKLRKNTSDFHVFAEIFIKHDYKFLIENYQKISPQSPPEFIIDIGANIGCASLYFKQIYSSATIVSVEAEKNNFLSLEHNISLNNYKDISLYHNAFWINEGNLMIEENFRDGRDWAFAIRPMAEKSSQIVKGLTLQNILEKRNVLEKPNPEKIDILKIDIEGGEKWILEDKNTMNLIRKSTKSLLIEIHEEVITMAEATKILIGFGFELVANKTLIFAYQK